MKKIYFILCLLTLGHISFAQVNNVGIGTTTPDPSAILELQATDQGFLLPRMDQSGENALPNPAQGLMIFNTDVNNGIGLQAPRFFNGSLWNTVVGQKSNGEIFLDNASFNIFNTTANSGYDFRFNNEPIITLHNDGGIRFHKPNSDENIWFFNGHSIRAHGNDLSFLHNLDLQNYAFFHLDGNIRFHFPNSNENIWFIDGHKITTLGNDNIRRHLILNDYTTLHNDGNIRFNFPNSNENIWFHDGHRITAIGNDGIRRHLILNEYATLHDNGNVRFNFPNSNENIWFQEGNSIRATGNDGTLKGLNLQNYAFFQGDGNIRFQTTNGGRKLMFYNANQIQVENSAGAAQVMHIQTHGAETVFGGEITAKNFRGYNVPIWNTNNADVDTKWIFIGNDTYHLARAGSSRRFKKDIRDAAFDFRSILQLKVKEYHMREGYGSKELQLGVIAEEAEDLGLNYLLTRGEGGIVDGFKYKYMGLYLLPVVQEQDKIIKEQQEKIEDLEARLARIEKLLSKE